MIDVPELTSLLNDYASISGESSVTEEGVRKLLSTVRTQSKDEVTLMEFIQLTKSFDMSKLSTLAAQIEAGGMTEKSSAFDESGLECLFELYSSGKRFMLPSDLYQMLTRRAELR